MKLPYFALAGLALLLAAGAYLMINTDMEERFSKMEASHDKQWQQLQESIKDMKNKQQTAPAPELVKEAVDAAIQKLKTGDPKTTAAAETEKEIRNAAGKLPPAINTAADNAVRKADELAAKARGAVNDIATDPPVLDPADAEAARIAREEQNVLNSTGIGVDRVALEAAAAANALPEGKAFNPIQSLIASQPAIARIKNPGKRGDEFVVLDAGQNAKLMHGDRFAVRRGTAIIARLTIGQTIQPTESVADVVPNTLVPGMVLETGDEIIKYDR